MDLQNKKNKLKEQNEFLISLLESFEDIKQGRTQKFKFSE